MAGIADMLVQGAMQSAQQSGEQLSSGIKTGAALAEQVERIQQNRALMEQKKQEMQQSKITKVAELYETAGKMEGKGQRFMYEKAIPNTIKALGVEDFFPESTHAILSSEPNAVPFLLSQVRQDPAKYDSIIGALQDPTGEELGRMFPDIKKFGALNELTAAARDNLKPLEDAQKFGLQQQDKAANADKIGGRLAGQFQTNQYQKVKDDFDSAIKDVRTELTAGNKAIAALDSGGPIAASAVRTQLARLSSEKGPLSDTDILTYGGSQDLFSRMNTLTEKLTTGNITEETRKEYRTLVDEYTRVAREKVRDEVERQADSAEGLGLNRNQAKKVLAADRLLVEPKGAAPKDWKKKIEGQLDRAKKLKGEERKKYIKGVVDKLRVNAKEVEALLGPEV